MATNQDAIKEHEAALNDLRDTLPVGSTVWTVLRHLSRSGMRREITAHYVADGEVRWANLTPLGYRLGNHGGWVVNGTGMDMSFHLVYNVALALHGDGYALTKRSL